MKKFTWLVLTLAVLSSAGYFLYPYALKTFFLVRGTVEIVPALAERAEKSNTMLFLVAKNESGIPVAVKKIINPVFPVYFNITPSNLIMPEVLTKKIFLEAFVNTHGELGIFKHGDLKGQIKSPIYVFTKKADILIDTTD